MMTRGMRRACCLAAAPLWLLLAAAVHLHAQPPPPELTAPVNDFAHVISDSDKAALEKVIRTLQQASGDIVVVATVETFAPYGDIQEYAVKMFENRGRGIGQKGKDNGVLVVLALKEREDRMEVGYDLEQFITDGFAGAVRRDVMVPFFRNGEYGAGLRAGVARVVQRIAQGRGITLTDFQEPVPTREPAAISALQVLGVAIFILVLLSLSLASTSRQRRRTWGGGPWSGWNSGVGPFAGRGGSGGTFGGGFGGFGGGGRGGGGFGGFGGGRSGGGGAGGGW